MEPPWIILRTIIPKPSLLALTVIPMVMEEHRYLLNMWLSNSFQFEFSNPYGLIDKRTGVTFLDNKNNQKKKYYADCLRLKIK